MQFLERGLAVAVVFCTLLGAAIAQDAPPPRAARSIHLAYTAPEAEVFYTEMTIEQSTAGSYFMAAGFNHGYFGLQEQGKGRKVVIFSVWDPTKGDDARAVPDDQRVEVLHKADDVLVKRFGGEGTGGQSFLEFDWKIGKTYRFMVKATVEEKKTAYAAYFFLPESNSWKHLVTFRTRTGGQPLRGLYSFVEDFRRDTKSATETRRAAYGNGWVKDLKGTWQPITKARFTASNAKTEAKETVDAGVAGEGFYLQTGGETRMTNKVNSSFERPAGNTKPPEVPQ